MLNQKVFIVLVNYNNVADTLECVDSIKKNDYSNYKIIIVDNKSTDRSCEYLRLNKNIFNYILLEADENNGFSSGNNIGIQYAMSHGADYVVLLNNDTLVDSSFLSELIGFQSSCSDCSVAIGKIYYAFDRNLIWYAGGSVSPITTRTIHFHFGLHDNQTIGNSPMQVSFATGCYMSIRREIVEKIGLLDEDYFLYDEDTDYSLRLAINNKNIYYVPSSVIYHKVSASTGSGSDLSQYYQVRNHFLLIKKNVKFPYSVIAVGYTVLFLIKRMLKGELNPQNVWDGIIGYLQGETGKRK